MQRARGTEKWVGATKRDTERHHDELLNFLLHCAYDDPLFPPTHALTQPASALFGRLTVSRQHVQRGTFTLGVLWPFFSARRMTLSRLYGMSREQLQGLCREACMTPAQLKCFTLAFPQFAENSPDGCEAYSCPDTPNIFVTRSPGMKGPQLVCQRCSPHQFAALEARCGRSLQPSTKPQFSRCENAEDLRNFRVPPERMQQLAAERQLALAMADETKAVISSLRQLEADPFSPALSDGFEVDQDLVKQVVESFADGGEDMPDTLSAHASLAMLRSQCTVAPAHISELHSFFSKLSKRGKRNVGWTIPTEEVLKVLAECASAHQFLLTIFQSYVQSCPYLLIKAEVEERRCNAQLARREAILSIFAALNLAVLSFEDVCRAFMREPSLQGPFIAVYFDVAAQRCASVPLSKFIVSKVKHRKKSESRHSPAH